MILAQEFSRSQTSRLADFSTSLFERGTFELTERHSSTTRRVRGALVAQFAANDARVFADACELVSPFVDGVDLNCGASFPYLRYDDGTDVGLKDVPRNGHIRRRLDVIS